MRHWLRKTLDLVRKKCTEMDIDFAVVVESTTAFEEQHEVVPIDHARLMVRAKDYETAVFKWQKERPVDPDTFDRSDPRYPRDVIDHFAVFIGGKVSRAVHGLADERADGVASRWHDDSNGSAKTAILAAERSRLAWRHLQEGGLVSNRAAEAFEQRLTWLILELDRVFPNARRFVRPGFDG